MQNAKNSNSKAMVTILIAVAVIIVAGGWLFSTKRAQVNEKVESAELTTGVFALKQDLSDLKTKRGKIAASAWETYELFLRAEIKGDQELAQKNYAAAKQAYREAIYYLLQSIKKSEHTAVTVPAAFEAEKNDSNTPTIDANDHTRNESVQQEEKKSSRSASRETRRHLATETGLSAGEKAPNVESTSAGTNEVLQSASNHAAESIVINTEKAVAENTAPATTPEAINVAAIIDRAEDRSAPEPLLAAEEPALSSETATTMLSEKAAREAAEKEIRALLDNYESGFEDNNTQRLQTLFNDGFTAEDKKAWLKFFKNARNVKANVQRGNIQIGDNTAELELGVSIAYANLKGIKQQPLKLEESWKLEKRNGSWVVVSRQLK